MRSTWPARLFAMQAAARRMIAQGHGGKIINMASQAGRRGEPLVLVYCATKAAVISMTQSAGLDLIRHGINVNAIAPGVVDGAHWDHVDAMFAALEGKPIGQKRAEVEAGVPAGRFAVPADLAPMAVFLASPDSDYVGRAVLQCGWRPVDELTRLSDAALRDLPAAVSVPTYDRAGLTAGIVHIGLGKLPPRAPGLVPAPADATGARA